MGIISLAILTNSRCNFIDHKHISSDRIKLTSSVLSIIDGSSLMEVKNVLIFGKHIMYLLNGGKKNDLLRFIKNYYLNVPPKLFNTQNIEGVFLWEGKSHSLASLAQIEEGMTKKELDQTYDKRKEIIREAAEHIEKISADYMEEINHIKLYITQLIQQWSEMRNYPTTLLLDWSKMEGSDYSQLVKRINTINEFSIFLCDLSTFLADLLHSCPKSLTQYKESCKK